MPVVPSVQERPLATPYQNAVPVATDAPGRALQQVGQQFSQTGNEMFRLALYNKARDQERLAKEGDLEYSRKRRELLFGDDGYFNRQGSNAVDTREEVMAQLEKLEQETISKYKDPEVQRMLSTSIGTRREADYQSIQQYVMKERKTAYTTASDARVKEAIDDAAMAYNDPDQINRSLSIIKSEIIQKGEFLGAQPEVIQSQLEEAQTLMFKTTILSAVKRGDVATAKDLFEKHSSQMDGPIAAEVKAMLEDQSVLAEAQAQSDAIIEQNLNEAESLAEARKIKDPATRAKTEELVKSRLSEKRVLEKNAFDDLRKQAFNEAFNGNFTQWQREHPEEYALLQTDPSTIKELRVAAQMAADGNEFSDISDRHTYYETRELSTEELAKIDLNALRTKLTKDEYDDLYSTQIAARAALQEQSLKNSQNRDVYRTGVTVMKDLYQSQLAWGTQEQNTKQRKKQQLLVNGMNNFIHRYTSQGLVPSYSDIYEEAKRLGSDLNNVLGDANAFYKWWSGDDTVMGAEIAKLTPEQRSRVKVDLEGVFPDDIAEAKSVFAERGIEASESTLESYFGALAVGDQERIDRLLSGTPEPAEDPLVEPLDQTVNTDDLFNSLGIGNSSATIEAPAPGPQSSLQPETPITSAGREIRLEDALQMNFNQASLIPDNLLNIATEFGITQETAMNFLQRLKDIGVEFGGLVVDRVQNALGNTKTAEAPSPAPAVVNKQARAEADMDSIVSRIAQIESGGDPNAKAKTSSATGLYQFTEQTWLDTVAKYEPALAKGKTRADLLALRTDPDTSTRVVKYLIQDNISVLNNWDIPVTPGNIYLAHFLGAGNLRKVSNADENDKIKSVLSNAVVKANPFLKDYTVGQLKDWSDRKMTA